MRVREKPPFSYTGVDFAGPVYARESLASDTRKLWICLFTCLVTRAVHIDLVSDMTVASFLGCFKRFTARRSIPLKILSDNAKTFKGANKWITGVISHDRVKDHLLECGTSWKFNVERAPWWGGAFERMIQSTKRLLRKIIGMSRLTYDELATAIIEVESILNSRPLTHVSCDELQQPLTPSHLLCGRRTLAFPDVPTDSEEGEDYVPASEANNLTRRMKHLSGTLDQFWKRWREEYLLELRNAHRISCKASGQSTVQAGDIVIIEDDTLLRGYWKLGIIESLLVGRDGEVRAVSVRTHSKDHKPIVLKRPIQKLYPLGVRREESRGDSVQPTDPNESQSAQTSQSKEAPITSNLDVTGDQLITRPRRAAAEEARKRMKSWAMELNGSSRVDK